MVVLRVFDPPMCCSTGVCGPEVDPALVRFAADLKWLGEQGVTVQRFNLTQTPIAFAENETVHAILTEKGESALPLVLVDGKVVVTGTYPSREELAGLVGLSSGKPSLFSPAVGEQEDGLCRCRRKSRFEACGGGKTGRIRIGYGAGGGHGCQGQGYATPGGAAPRREIDRAG